MKCLTARIPELFKEGAVECNACILLCSFEDFLCRECGEHKRGTEVFLASASPDEYCCFKCAPELCLIGCTVCKKQKPSTEFQGHARQVQAQTIRRCQQCYICQYCKKVYDDARHLLCNKNVCSRCGHKERVHKCGVCGVWLTEEKFSVSDLGNASRLVTLRCSSCHECAVCRRTLHGNVFENASSKCIQCSKHRTCAACGENT